MAPSTRRGYRTRPISTLCAGRSLKRWAGWGGAKESWQALLKRSDATPLPTLFVEGESDVAILTAAWRTFGSESEETAGNDPRRRWNAPDGKPLPVAAWRCGNCSAIGWVFALADNDREGRALVEDGRTRRGGPMAAAVERHSLVLARADRRIREGHEALRHSTRLYWPFTIENACPSRPRCADRQLIREHTGSMKPQCSRHSSKTPQHR